MQFVSLVLKSIPKLILDLIISDDKILGKLVTISYTLLNVKTDRFRHIFLKLRKCFGRYQDHAILTIRPGTAKIIFRTAYNYMKSLFFHILTLIMREKPGRP